MITSDMVFCLVCQHLSSLTFDSRGLVSQIFVLVCLQCVMVGLSRCNWEKQEVREKREKDKLLLTVRRFKSTLFYGAIQFF